MSSNLEWRPTDPIGESLSDETKYALRRLFGDPVRVTLNCSKIPLLVGLKAGTENKIVKDECNALIDAIEKHDCIDVEEVHR